jgi:hypothetical protein
MFGWMNWDRSYFTPDSLCGLLRPNQRAGEDPFDVPVNPAEKMSSCCSLLLTAFAERPIAVITRRALGCVAMPEKIDDHRCSIDRRWIHQRLYLCF